MDRQLRTVLIVLGSVAVAILIAGLVAVITLVARNPRQDLEIAYFADSAEPPDAFDGIVRNTEAACAGREACIEGYVSSQLTVTRYTTTDAAQDAATNSPFDTYRSDWIVVEYTEHEIDPTGRLHLEQLLDGTWQSEADGQSHRQDAPRHTPVRHLSRESELVCSVNAEVPAASETGTSVFVAGTGFEPATSGL